MYVTNCSKQWQGVCSVNYYQQCYCKTTDIQKFVNFLNQTSITSSSPKGSTSNLNTIRNQVLLKKRSSRKTIKSQIWYVLRGFLKWYASFQKGLDSEKFQIFDLTNFSRTLESIKIDSARDFFFPIRSSILSRLFKFLILRSSFIASDLVANFT